MFEDDLVIQCYDTAKLALYNMYMVAQMDYNKTPWWNIKYRWILRGSKATFLLIIENLNRFESDYKIKKIKENPNA